jgi:putative Mg2+ transporter-C (MgtC) family protein
MMSVDAQLEALLRLILAGVAGAVIGLEREVEDKPAGVRTFATVALGSALFTIAPAIAFPDQPDSAARVAAQIVTGIGFLGAGTIIQVRDRVEGLTTAAGIWAVAAIGMSFGFGLYVLGAGATAIILLLIVTVGRALFHPAQQRRAHERDDTRDITPGG